jgi:hypothetical protein
VAVVKMVVTVSATAAVVVVVVGGDPPKQQATAEERLEAVGASYPTGRRLFAETHGNQSERLPKFMLH